MLRLKWFASIFGFCPRDLRGRASRGLPAAWLFLILAGAARAAVLGEGSFEAGGGLGQVETGTSDTDLKGWFLRWNQPTGKLLFIQSDTRLTYLDTRNDGGVNDLKWRGADLAILLSLKFPGIRPFASISGSYEKFYFATPTANVDAYKWGYSGGVGLELGFIPLVTITPAARYTVAGDIERVSYSVDASLWIKSFGFGVNFSETDVQSSPVKVQQGLIYAGFRF